MKKQIKELRIKIDGLAQLTKELKPFGELIENEGIYAQIFKSRISKEIEEATDNLYLAKAWLGKVLGELDTETPYKNDGNRKTVEDIEPIADEANLIRDIDYLVQYKKITEKENHIEKVDWLRQEIQKLILDVETLDSNFSQHQSQKPSREFAISRTNSYNYLCEARMWLGFELGRVKKEQLWKDIVQKEQKKN